ncbi:MAG: hypothetical protein H7230_03350 [Candidatus Parcubacteria bacterium]|nr:hypothetical protein [Candidatus Paceibacterota bacterium]
MTKDISVSFLTNHFLEVQKMLDRNWIVRVLNSKSKAVIATMYPGQTQKIAQSATIIIDDIPSEYLIPITNDQKQNLYEVSAQNPAQYNQKPLYRYSTSR